MGITKIDTSNTVSTTEFSFAANANYNIAAPQTAVAIVEAFVDVSTLAAGDQFQFRIYESVGTSGTQRVVYESTLTGAQYPPQFVFPSLVLTDAWDVTAKKLAGTDRVLKASVRQVS